MLKNICFVHHIPGKAINEMGMLFSMVYFLKKNMYHNNLESLQVIKLFTRIIYI